MLIFINMSLIKYMFQQFIDILFFVQTWQQIILIF